ncbi:MAG: SDR family NAD(P)-dependent oxidoreductase [Planctomycetota bacterium]
MAFQVRGRRALVTGASAGIGREIARVLAERGARVAVVARRRDRLEELADELRAAHGTDVQVVESDLADPAGVRSLLDAVEAEDVDVLVNNAGFGIHGDGLDHDWEDEHRMLRLNVIALAELTKHYARAMRARGSGRILQVASIAAFQPCPSYAAYAATKAFVLQHAQALDDELRGTDVRVTALCPGTTNTDFFDIAGNVRNRIQKATSKEPDFVARVGVDAMIAGRRIAVTGLGNKIAVAALRVVPRRLQVTLARRVLE